MDCSTLSATSQEMILLIIIALILYKPKEIDTVAWWCIAIAEIIHCSLKASQEYISLNLP